MPKISYQEAADGMEGRLTRAEAARFLGVSSKTLAEWKRLGKGPPCVKITNRCFYRVADLHTYIKIGEAMNARRTLA